MTKIKGLSSSQISLIMKKGGVCNSGSFLFKTHITNNLIEGGILRGSFIVSKKKIKKAVDRNKIKRIFKESFLEAFNNLSSVNTTINISPFIVLIKTNKSKFVHLTEEIRQFLLKNYIIKQ